MQMTRHTGALALGLGLNAGWLTGPLQRMIRAMQGLIDHERTLLALSELSDEQLKDIGLNRRELSANLRDASVRR